MLLKSITTDELFGFMQNINIQPDDYLVILEVACFEESYTKKMLRFPSREALIDFLCEDLPLILFNDLNNRQLFEQERPVINPLFLTELREALGNCYSTEVSPNREGIINRTIQEWGEKMGMENESKTIGVSLDWLGQPWELPTAENPFLEEIRAGLSESTGTKPSPAEILQFLLGNEEASGYFRMFLEGWYVMPGETMMDMTPDDIEQGRYGLQYWLEILESHPQPLLATRWRYHYNRLKRSMEGRPRVRPISPVAVAPG